MTLTISSMGVAFVPDLMAFGVLLAQYGDQIGTWLIVAAYKIERCDEQWRVQR